MKDLSSVCRICTSGCGVRVTIDDTGKVRSVTGDRNHPLTAGHTCFKGLQAGATHNSANRLLRPQKRMPNGNFEPIGVEQALDEIAEILRRILDAGDAEAIATYTGGPGFFHTPVPAMMTSFRNALSTTGNYSSITIDQPGKAVTAERLGFWNAGKTPLDDSNVLMLVGTNPLVSFQCVGILTTDPVKSLKRAKSRGMKLVVIDPRRTETAKQADVFLQPIPGEDTAVLAGLINVILRRGLEDREFTSRYVRTGHMEALAKAVAPFTGAYVRRRTGVDERDLVAAAELFMATGAPGSVFSGTGPSMGPHGSTAEHLVEVINVLGGRFPREGAEVRDITPWLPYRERTAEVVGPLRSWEQHAPGRIRGVHSLYDQKLTCNLADEIVTPGRGQVRALINVGGNIAANVPDQRKVVRALSALDLLVTIEPFMTNTAKLSHYVFAPKLQYERPDMPIAYPGQSFQPRPWAQYLPAIAAVPEGSELVEDWYVFWALAHRLGKRIEFCGVALDPSVTPTSDQLIELTMQGSVVPLSTIKQHLDGGTIFNLSQRVAGPSPNAGKFEPMPPDVQEELSQVLGEDFGSYDVNCGNVGEFTHRLAVRRSKDLINAQGLYTDSIRQRAPYNPACMNPEDMRRHGLVDGQLIYLVSRTDQVIAAVQGDPTVHDGMVTMSHGWGGLPDEDDGHYEQVGACVNRLLDGDNGLDPFSAIAVMTGVPLRIVPLEADRQREMLRAVRA